MRVKRVIATLLLLFTFSFGGVLVSSTAVYADGVSGGSGSGPTFSDGTSATNMPSGMYALDDQYVHKDCGVGGGDYIISHSVYNGNCHERRCIDSGRTFTNEHGVEFAELDCYDFYYPDYLYADVPGPAWRSGVREARYRNNVNGDVVVYPGQAWQEPVQQCQGAAYWCPDGSVYYYPC